MKKLFLSVVLCMTCVLIYAQNETGAVDTTFVSAVQNNAIYTNHWFVSVRANAHLASFDDAKRIGNPTVQGALEVGRSFHSYHDGVFTLGAFADYGMIYAYPYVVSTGLKIQDLWPVGKHGLIGPSFAAGAHIVLDSDASVFGATLLLSAGITTEWRVHEYVYITAGAKADFACSIRVIMPTVELGIKVPFQFKKSNSL